MSSESGASAGIIDQPTGQPKNADFDPSKLIKDSPDTSSPASKLISNLQSSASALGDFKDNIVSFAVAVGGMTKQLLSSNLSASNALTQTAASISSSASEAGAKLINTIEAKYIGPFKGASAITQNMDSGISSFESQRSGAVYQIADRIKSKDGKNFATELLNGVSAASKGADAFTNFRTALLTSAAAAGKLQDNLGDMSNLDMSKLNEGILRSGAEMVRSAGIIGTTSEAYIKAYTDIQSATPNFFKDQSIKVGDSNLDETQAVLALKEGTGRSLDDIKRNIQDLGKVYNLSSSDSLEYIAKMSMVNDKFKIGSDAVKSVFDKNIKAFEYQITKGGDNSLEALNRMMKGFQDTGLSAKQSAELIGEMTSNIGSMDVATKSFLSSQTGGPGGLRGAFEIEGLLSEGKVNEVLGKVEENIKKNFGNKIYTLNEARESDYAASQFMRQREMLKSGAFGVKIDSDAKASRVLEYMAGGSRGDGSELKDALGKYAGAGKTIMEQNVTPLSLANMVAETEQLTNSFRNLNDLIASFTIDKENLAKIAGVFLKLRSNNKSNDKKETVNQVTQNTIKSVESVGGRAASALKMFRVVSDRDMSFRDRGELVKEGLGQAITGQDPSAKAGKTAKQKDDRSNKQNQTQKKAYSGKSQSQRTEGPTIDVIDMDAAQQQKESALNSAGNNNAKRNQRIDVSNYATAVTRPNLDATRSAYQSRAQGGSTAPTNIVAPTVQLAVDITCPNCSTKQQKVAIIRPQNNETGGLTYQATKQS